MGGLGNGRRGGRSPPLMIGALIACILVLGFNYWVSSSRNLELQTKMYELEGQVRRGAAERGVAEMKKNQFQEELQRQREQITRMESLHKRQLEGAQNTCSQEKGTLQQDVSSSAKTIQELKGQLSQLKDELGKLQKQVQSCQGNIKSLGDKLAYDKAQCDSQVQAQKEMCEERVAALQKKKEKQVDLAPGLEKDNPLGADVKDAAGLEIAASDVAKAATAVSHTPSAAHPGENEPPELLTNDIIVEKAPVPPGESLPTKSLSKEQPQSVPPAPEGKQDVLLPAEGAVATQEADAGRQEQNNLTEERGAGLLDAPDDGAHTEVADPGLEDMLEVKADEGVDPKPDDQDEYEGDERVPAGDLEKQQQSKPPGNIDLEQELADYNGDDENEGEFEADKQAALAQI